MVYSPHSYFSTNRERIITIESVEVDTLLGGTSIEDIRNYNGESVGFSYHGSPVERTPENISEDDSYLVKYHGCRECWKFSMLFGGSYEAIFGDKPEKRNIQTEDDFEVVKGEFVAHFNEKHKDLFPIRKAKMAKAYKIKPKPEPTPFGTSPLTTANTNNIAIFDLMEVDIDRLQELYNGMIYTSGRQSGRWARFINSLRRD